MKAKKKEVDDEKASASPFLWDREDVRNKIEHAVGLYARWMIRPYAQPTVLGIGYQAFHDAFIALSCEEQILFVNCLVRYRTFAEEDAAAWMALADKILGENRGEINDGKKERSG